MVFEKYIDHGRKWYCSSTSFPRLKLFFKTNFLKHNIILMFAENTSYTLFRQAGCNNSIVRVSTGSSSFLRHNLQNVNKRFTETKQNPVFF